MGAHPVDIWTDGGQVGSNPGNGAGAAILSYQDKIMVATKALGMCTNNYAETWGAIVGLKVLRRPCAVRIFTDSQYVNYGIRKVLKFNKTHKTNVDAWEEFIKTLMKGMHDIRDVQHTYGHSKDEMNNLADAWAGYSASTQKDYKITYYDVMDALENAPKKGRRNGRSSH